MKKNAWESIKNGLKKAVEFVVNVLLFVPRFLINGIKGFFTKEAESEELEEEFDDESEETEKPVDAAEEQPKQEETKEDKSSSEDNKPAEVIEEPKQEEAKVEETVDKAEVTEDKVEEKSETEKPVDVAEEQPKQEETTKTSTDKKVEIKVTVAATEEPAIEDKAEEKSEAEKPVEPTEEQPKQEETENDKSKEDKSSSEDNKPAESGQKQEETQEQQKVKRSNKKTSVKATAKVEKVSAEVIDNQTGKVVKDNVNVESKEAVKEMAIFGKTDKKAMNLENGFISYFNNSVKKYNKSLWADGATELQKFARAYLDAIAVKEDISATKGQSRYNDIIDALKGASLMSEQDEIFLKSCLGRQNYMQTITVQPRLNTAYNLMVQYQLNYYPEWCATITQQPFNPDAGVATA